MSNAETSAPAGTEVCVGILILVPEPLAGRVRALRESVADPEGAEIPAHVTLVPPTPLPESVLPAVMDHLEAVAAKNAPFELRLCGTDSFQPVTDVSYLRVLDGADDCDRLQDALRTGPLEGELRYPYHPHVTLAHDVPQAGLDRALAAMGSVDERFTVDRFVLFVDREEWQRAAEFHLAD